MNLRQNFEKEALDSRRAWKEGFDKSEERKKLEPKMAEITGKQDIFKEFIKNPLPYIEAMAFKESFPTIAEKVKADAIEQYKKGLAEAEEAENQRKTAQPAGGKKSLGEVDVSKLSSADIASMLPRGQD